MASAAPPLAAVAALPQAWRWPANQPSPWHLLLQYRTSLHLAHVLRHMAPHTSQGPKAVGIAVSMIYSWLLLNFEILDAAPA